MEQNNLTILQLQLRFFNPEAYKYILLLSIFTYGLCQQNILDQAILKSYINLVLHPIALCSAWLLRPSGLRVISAH